MPKVREVRESEDNRRFLEFAELTRRSEESRPQGVKKPEALSLRGIAGELGVKPNTLSVTLSRLEKREGVQLVERRPGGPASAVTLTKDGEKLEERLRTQSDAATAPEPTEATREAQGAASRRPTRLLLHPFLLTFDSVQRVLQQHSANLQVFTSNSPEDIRGNVRKGYVDFAVVLGNEEATATAAGLEATVINVGGVVLVGGDERFFDDEGEIKSECLRKSRFIRLPSLGLSLDDGLTSNDSAVGEATAESPEVALAMARAGLGYTALPAGDYSTLHRYRRTGELFFSKEVGTQQATFVLRKPGEGSLRDEARGVFASLRDALRPRRDRGIPASPYGDPKLTRLPNTKGRYSGRKYGYYTAFEPAKPEGDSGGGEGDRGRLNWYAETIDFTQVGARALVTGEAARLPGNKGLAALDLTATITNLSPGEHKKPAVFTAKGQQQGETFLALFCGMTPKSLSERNNEYLCFSLYFNAYYQLDEGNGVWLGRWVGVSRGGKKPFSYAALMSDRPLSQQELLEMAAMIDLLAILKTDQVDQTVLALHGQGVDAHPAHGPKRRSSTTPNSARKSR